MVGNSLTIRCVNREITFVNLGTVIYCLPGNYSRNIKRNERETEYNPCYENMSMASNFQVVFENLLTLKRKFMEEEIVCNRW